MLNLKCMIIRKWKGRIGMESYLYTIYAFFYDIIYF